MPLKIAETEDVENDHKIGVKMVIVAAMLAEYGGRFLKDGARFALKNHVNGIISNAAGIERLFVTNRWLTEEERDKFKDQFCGNSGSLIAYHLQNLFGLSEESLEAIIMGVEEVINPKTESDGTS